MSNRILPYVINKTAGTKDLETILGATVESIHNYAGFECVGIRVKTNGDYPYRRTVGFSESFIEKESSLLSKDENGDIVRTPEGEEFLECMCGNVIQKRFDPFLPFFTKNGSFWTNSTTHLLASTTEKERQAHARNYCNDVGFESVGIFALNAANGVCGAIHITDTKMGMFTSQKIETFELVAVYISGLVNLFVTLVDELRNEIATLKQYNKLMEGRELRIIELKNEIKKLEGQLRNSDS